MKAREEYQIFKRLWYISLFRGIKPFLFIAHLPIVPVSPILLVLLAGRIKQVFWGNASDFNSVFCLPEKHDVAISI